MNDFLPVEEAPFRKGKARTQEAKPWQIIHEGKVVQKVRCWDDPFGCEKFVVRGDAKWHPHLCDNCATTLCSTYGAKQRDVDVLVILLKQDESLQKSAKAMGGSADKLEALYKGRSQHIPDLLRSVLEVWKTPPKVTALTQTYRLWFYDQAGVDTAKSRKPTPGFAPMNAAVPVGDRA